MSFSIERPYAVYGFLFLIPAVLFTLLRYKKIIHALVNNSDVQNGSSAVVRLKHCFILRTFFRGAAWVMLVLAYAGISWGINTVPVQKSGSVVSFVFDISYSMMAKDGPGGISRLEAESNYAETLLNHMGSTSVSVILAKGDGVVTVPLTEDYNTVRNLVRQLNPNMLTAEGTNLGSGVRAAISSFPVQSARAGCIWVFTDGEETEVSLLEAINEAVSYGIPVAIIGFGSEHESELTLADGRTKIKTALRTKSIERILSQVKTIKSGSKNNSDLTPVVYIDASEFGSANRLMKMISLQDNASTVTYEVHLIPRQNIFITLALIMFIFSIIAGEVDVKKAIKNFSKGSAVVLLFTMFTSCSPKFNEGRLLFEGKLEWNRKNYQQATAYFLEVEDNAKKNEDRRVAEYARFNLAVTYLMQDENDTASEYFSKILEEATESTDSQVRYAALYNSGIIAHRQGKYDDAAEFFKQALEVDNSSTDAKINLELSMQENSLQVKSGEQQVVPVTQNNTDSTLENAVYSIIRENEENQWKNQQQKNKSSSLDY